MRKFVKLGICGLMAAMVATGCSKKDTTGTTDPAAATTQGAETQEAGTSEGAAEDSVTLGEYKGVAYTPASVEITDEKVDNEVQKLADSNLVEVDRPAAEGDTVNIDYVGKKDGVAFDGGTAEGYDLELGSDAFIDGFEDGLIGANVGEERSLNLTFPEDYGNADLAGQAVVFDVTVNKIEEKKNAILDDAFVQRVSDFSTVDEFKADTMAALQEEKEQSAAQQVEDDAFAAAVDNSEYSLNEAAVEQQYNNQLTYYENMFSSYGFTMESYRDDWPDRG